MENEEGISVRPMRLKVLYTFDNESKTNCLARWPHILDIQTAYLDETTQVGVIELKTCIQTIVSASPELVAKLGRDYTVYAYDYSEYETPLVGQGMLSWVLASASPTPNAPAHRSKTIVTGRVCKNTGLFARGAQETLEVKLRLVPVPTVLQSEYLESMQKYRELSNLIPHDFDAQAWTAFLKSNPGLLSGSSSSQNAAESEHTPLDRSGLEKLQQLLSDGSTPRELPTVGSGSFRADSPTHFSHNAPSRASTPGVAMPAGQQKRPVDEINRPGSRASILNPDSYRTSSRRGSIMSNYGSGDEATEGPAPKRAKLVRTDISSDVNTNIERQPNSLRVAASTAASVRIHRPTPITQAGHPSLSNEEPVRPPTPVPSLTQGPARRNRIAPSNLRRQSLGRSDFSQSSPLIAPMPLSNSRLAFDSQATSPEEPQYSMFTDTPFNMPSSPPIMETNYAQASSPGLPPLSDHDSGFLSAQFDSLIDDDTNQNDRTLHHPQNNPNMLSSAQLASSTGDSAPALPLQPSRISSSRPSSRASMKSVKSIAPATQRASVPASDPIRPSQPWQPQTQPLHPLASEFPLVSTPGSSQHNPKPRSGAGAKRTKQVKARLEQCIREGTVPPYCENCGAIETPTWRRAHSKVIPANAEQAEAYNNDQTILFWEPSEPEEDGSHNSIKIYKKSLAHDDIDFVQLLLCNSCGLWLYKFKSMRPEHKWDKVVAKEKSKRKLKPIKAQPLETRTRRKTRTATGTESSPGPSDASSPEGDEGATTQAENDTQPEVDAEANKGNSKQTEKVRASSAEPLKSAEKHDRWRDQDPFEALRRAIQSSPARNMNSCKTQFSEAQLTPKPVRRALFPSNKDGESMRSLSDSVINGLRRSPRSAHKKPTGPLGQENIPQTPADGLDHLFRDDDNTLDFPGSPTPNRRNRSIRSKKLHEAITNASPSQKAARALTQGSKDDSFQPDSTSPCKGLDTLDNMVLNFLASEADSFTHTDSLFQFDAPKTPISDSWANWDPNDCIPRNDQTSSLPQKEITGTPKSRDKARSGNKNPETPRRARSVPPISPFKSFLDSEINEISNLPESEIFDPGSFFDSHLTNSWSKDNTNSSPRANGPMEGLDPAVFAAMMQEIRDSTRSQ
ncbi:GATA transcription factor [Trichophyton equinum CBS 127.97]|uniref:GATA transcription factor n=1 Tax=Trichophyton equinum (strain ATCC MYA-4606 / CBS 127.97) TaxID=559882 RepID=F2Q088_TRIEC|nr:GATA transcription factor [Trichophyton equinum CBS 127.97]